MKQGYIARAKSTEYETPDDLFLSLDLEFHFTLDAAATSENTKCKRYFTLEDDGLKQSWAHERVFVNPPYGRDLRKWVSKAFVEVFAYDCETVVMLLPARTDVIWFQKIVLRYAEVRFLPGRITFKNMKGCAPFPVIVVIFRRPT